MSAPDPSKHVSGTATLNDHTPDDASFADEAAVAADLFDLAAPPLRQPLVARLVPMYAGLPTLNLHQDSGTVVVGRSKELSEDYRVNGCDKLSAKHCELIVDPVTLRVELRDTSTNGTFVNGVRVTKNEKVKLQNGDKVSLTRPTAAAETAGSDSSGSAPAEASIAANGRADFMLQRLKCETTKADMVAELTCSICRSVFHRPCSVLPCMHVFCAGCISGWLWHQQRERIHHTCPECREHITDVRPTHRLQCCVEQFLLSDPGCRRSPEEEAQLDAADTIPPTGLKLGKRQRGSEDEGESDSDSFDYSDTSGSSDGNTGTLRHVGESYVNRMGLSAARCTECSIPSSIDGFQCPAGGPHLRCTACRLPFAERPLCGRPQRCHVCNNAYCQLYRAGGCSADTLQPFRAYELHTPVEVLPSQVFGGNTIEQGIFSTYLAAHNIMIKDAWTTTLAKFAAGEWVPDMVMINGAMNTNSAVCPKCAVNVFAGLLFHYRRSIPVAELPESVTRRPNCWYGKECRTQFHNPQHAQNFNHVCYQEKRKE